MRRLEGVTGTENYEVREEFETFMNNDFDTSGALGVIFDLVKKVNTDLDEGKSVNGAMVLESLRAVDSVLGVVFGGSGETLDSSVEALIAEREEARKNKDFKRSDEIRDELKEKGIVLEDGAGGVRWRRG